METSAAAHKIREELARQRMSRARLADRAKISLSALEKCLTGKRKFTEATLTRIGDVLGVTLADHETATTAADELGGYARATVSWLEANYLTIRPSSKRATDLVTYITDVTWDAKAGHLVFKELARIDAAYAQFGTVAVPHQTGHIYFTTNRHGQQRLMVVKRDVQAKGSMYGLLLTLQQERGARLMPVAMPVALVPVKNLSAPPALGAVTPANKMYDEYRQILNRVTVEGFAGLLGQS
jgi:transcriptional regulator with XRE-family HTH domain